MFATVREIADAIFIPIEYGDPRYQLADDRVDKLTINPKDWASFQRIDKVWEVLDLIAHRTVLQTGMVAALWGASVYLDSKVPRNHYRVTTAGTGETFEICCKNNCRHPMCICRHVLGS